MLVSNSDPARTAVPFWGQTAQIPGILSSQRNRGPSSVKMGLIALGLLGLLTPLEPQSRFGDKLLEIRLGCPQSGTAVLKGLIHTVVIFVSNTLDQFKLVYSVEIGGDHPPCAKCASWRRNRRASGDAD